MQDHLEKHVPGGRDMAYPTVKKTNWLYEEEIHPHLTLFSKMKFNFDLKVCEHMHTYTKAKRKTKKL